MQSSSARMKVTLPQRIFALGSLFYLLTLRGFDTGEGMEHFTLARRWVSGGGLGSPEKVWLNQAQGPSGLWYNAHEFGNSLAMGPLAALQELLPARFANFDHLTV